MVVLFCFACDDSGSETPDDPDAGTEGVLGGPCYANSTCNAGLVCGAGDLCEAEMEEVDGPAPDMAQDAAVPTDAAMDGPPPDGQLPDGPPPPDAAQGCHATPCPGGQVCLDTGECAEPEVCADHDDCFEGRECVDGACETPCTEDAECPGTRVCVAGRCPEPDVCASPDDCDAPRRCVEGACADPCVDDDGCADGEACDPDTQTCRLAVRPACVEDADCPGSRACVEGECPEPEVCFGPEDCDAGRECIDSACSAPCEDDEACPGRQVCNVERGACEESGECVDAADCEGARVCSGGACVDPCAGDEACPGTRVCDPVTRVCEEAQPCFVLEDCDGDRVCFEGACVDTCVDARPCPGGLRCDQASGLCAEPDVCAEDADCRGARVCDGGACHAPCAVDDDCVGAQRCDAETGHCAVEGGCQTDEDCPGLSLCGAAGACFLPDCETNDDCEGACVDRRCAEGPPMACGPDTPCPRPQVCTALGACALDAACRANSDCPAESPRCDAFDGRCFECLADVDCAGAERCEGRSCVYDGACDDDDACPGDRSCRAGVCVESPDCAGDRFDLDPAAAQLERRTYTGLVLCDGDEDRFGIAVPAGEGLRVVLRHAPGAGRLTAVLQDEGGQLLSRSGLGHGLEVVGVAPTDQPRELDLVVLGRPGHSVTYALTIERLPPDTCVPDELEGLLGNDDAAHSTWVELGEHQLELCPDEQDWLAFDLPAGVRLSVTPSAVEPGDAASATLFRPDDVQIDVAALGGEITHEVLVPGTYRLRLESPAARPVPVRVGLSAFAAEEAEARACAHPIALDGDALVALPLHPTLPRFDVSCAPAVEGDAVLRFVLDAPALVSVRATGASAVAVREECAVAESERACQMGPEPALDELALDAGEFFLVVKTPGPERAAVSLTVRASCDDDGDCGGGVCDGGLCHDRCEVDDDCPGAQTCRAGDGHCLEAEPCGAAIDCMGPRQCHHDGGCFLPDCERNADCADGACVDQLCAAAAPAECDGDDDCADPLTCAPFGACRLEGPCAADADCPPGAPVCEADRCVICVGDEHCRPGEACEAGRCAYQGVCEGPQDCPGERTCGDGLCRPPDDCAGDRFDGLQAPAALVTRTYGGLLLCDGATDQYSVAVAPGDGLRVVLRHDPAQGDLSLRVETPPPISDLLGQSDGPLGVEVVQLPADPLGGPRVVAVRGRPGFATPYALTVERVDAGVCAPDALEGVDGNDDAEHATAIEAGVFDLRLCPDDEDWFAFDLGPGTRLSVRATPTPATPLAISLRAPGGGGSIVDAQDDGGAWVLEADIAEAGRHLLRVHAPDVDDARDVELQVEIGLGDDPESIACRDPLEVEPGQRAVFPAGQPVLRFAHSCGFGMRDYLASFTLQAPATVSLETSPGTALALRSVCANAPSEFMCAFAGDAALDAIELQAGTYYVVLQRLEEEPPELLLTIR